MFYSFCADQNLNYIESGVDAMYGRTLSTTNNGTSENINLNYHVLPKSDVLAIIRDMIYRLKVDAEALTVEQQYKMEPVIDIRNRMILLIRQLKPLSQEDFAAVMQRISPTLEMLTRNYLVNRKGTQPRT